MNKDKQIQELLLQVVSLLKEKLRAIQIRNDLLKGKLDPHLQAMYTEKKPAQQNMDNLSLWEQKEVLEEMILVWEKENEQLAEQINLQLSLLNV